MLSMNKKMCAYIGCKRGVPSNYYLCKEHFKDEQDGIISKCPECGRYKDAEYELCFECYKKRPNKESKKAKIVDSAGRYFVYILKLDNGDYYVGETDSLRERIEEHKDGKTITTKGRNPVLQYFEIVMGRDAAIKRESELTALNKVNNRLVRKMINEFKDWIQKVDEE
jgi:predicted GIY-YIG superfamily endonuclease